MTPLTLAGSSLSSHQLPSRGMLTVLEVYRQTHSSLLFGGGIEPYL